MVKKRAEWPQADEYAVALATKVAPYGAYVTLPEYGDKEGFIHISEISSTWVRNIRNHIHENMRTVVKVLQVDTQKKHIDCSLRRVSAEAKRAKNNEWKRAQKAEKLLEVVAKGNNMTLEQIYDSLGWPLEDTFGEIYRGLERAADTGVEAFKDVNAPKELLGQIADLAKTRIEIPSVDIDGELSIVVPGPAGINVIKQALTAALDQRSVYEKSSIDIYALGAPRYKLHIVSQNYKEAEEILQSIVDLATKGIEGSGGTVSFSRK